MALRFFRRLGSILIALARLQFLAVGENYFLQAHDVRPVLQTIADNGDHVSGLQRVFRPAGPGKVVRAVGLDEPLFGVALVVFRFEVDRRVRIDERKLRDGPLHRHGFGQIVVRRSMMRIHLSAGEYECESHTKNLYSPVQHCHLRDFRRFLQLTILYQRKNILGREFLVAQASVCGVGRRMVALAATKTHRLKPAPQ
jgi:hypothetical protein